MKQGPTLIKEQYQSCMGCEYLSYSMLRSGREPVYEYYCTHPKWTHELALARLSGMKGRYIGKRGYCPSWCPLRKE